MEYSLNWVNINDGTNTLSVEWTDWMEFSIGQMDRLDRILSWSNGENTI